MSKVGSWRSECASWNVKFETSEADNEKFNTNEKFNKKFKTSEADNEEFIVIEKFNSQMKEKHANDDKKNNDEQQKYNDELKVKFEGVPRSDVWRRNVGEKNDDKPKKERQPQKHDDKISCNVTLLKALDRQKQLSGQRLRGDRGRRQRRRAHRRLRAQWGHHSLHHLRQQPDEGVEGETQSWACRSFAQSQAAATTIQAAGY